MSIEFAAKVVASGAALFPIIFLYDDAVDRYTKKGRDDVIDILQNPYVIGIFAFGTALAATGDTRATVTAMIILGMLYSLHESKLDEEEEESK